MTSLPHALPDAVFRRVFLCSPNAALLRDADGRILAVNTAFEALFGVEAPDVVGCDLRQVVRPVTDRADGDGEVWSLRGAAFLRETRWTAGGDGAADVIVRQYPVGVTDGKPVSCVIFRDISSRRRAEEQLRAAERKYRSIFENAVEGIFQTTPAGRYLEVNRTLARIYGFASVAEMTEYFRDIKNQLYVDPRRRDDFVRELAAHDQVHNFESRIRKKDGTVIWISENARVVRDQAGEAVYYEGTVVDITDRKRAEEGLAAQRAYFAQLFANSPQAITLIDMHRNIIDANKAFEALFGYRADDVKGFGMRTFIVPENLLPECENVRAAILTGKIRGARNGPTPSRRPAHSRVHDRLSHRVRRGNPGHRLHLPGYFRTQGLRGTDHPPGLPRRPDRPAQPQPVRRPPGTGPDPGQTARRCPVRRAHDRPQQVQGRQRHPGPSGRGPAPGGGGPAAAGLRAVHGHGGPSGRRRIRRHPGGTQGQKGSHGRGRAHRSHPRQAFCPVRRDRDARGQHRHRAAHPGIRQRRRHPARRGHRHVPGQGAGPVVHGLRPQDAPGDPRRHQHRGGPAPGACARGTAAALSAHRRRPERPHRGLRGPWCAGITPTGG